MTATAVVLLAPAGMLALARGEEPGSSLLAPGPAVPDTAPEPSPTPRIDTTAGAGTDRAIERRLRGIFGELDGLGDLRIAARDGVVDLSGEVLSSDLRERAVRIARQVQGVVEVEDRIDEVRDVQRRLAPVVERLVDHGWRLVARLPVLAVAASIFGTFWLIGWIVARWDAPFRRITRNRFFADLLQGVVRGSIMVAGLVIALDVLDASALVGTVLGAAGVLGLALGFALRDTVENYIASLLLSLRQPFGHDDLVRIETWEGHILRLTSRATVLMTLDGDHVRIPNAVVYKSVIVNHTRNPARRFHFDVGVGTEQDLATVQKLGAATLGRMEGVLADPPPVATVEALGESSIVIRLAGWVDQRHADFLKVRSEAIRLVKQAFDAADVTMPEPIYSVRLSGGAVGGVEAPRSDGATVPQRPAPQGPTVAIDIAPHDPLARRRSGERRVHAEDDLLTRDALPE